MHAVLKNILFLLQEWLETHEEIIGFPSGLAVENLPARAQDIKDTGSIPGSGRSPGGGTATHSSILAWIILWTEEPGGLQSTGLQRVRHD